jgi:hypothetical protein
MRDVKSVPALTAIALCLGLGLSGLCSAESSELVQSGDSLTQALSHINDIRKLPLLKKGLKPGTIAIAFADQLHPTQDQTGHKELRDFKIPFFEDLLKKDGKEFSENLFKEILKHKSISPVFLYPPLEADSRHGQFETLGWVTDRTHGSDAQSHVYKKAYGHSGLDQLLFDEKGRPLNFILVQVQEDLSHLSESEFIHYMQRNSHCYLEKFERTPDGETEIKKSSFRDLPEKVYETKDNPFRGLIGVLQHLKPKVLGHNNSDFFQFIDAKALAQSKVVSWDEIDKQASDKVYNKALKKAEKFFKSKQAAGLPGVPASPEVAGKCEISL